MPKQNISSYTEEAIQDLRSLKIPRHRRRRIWKPFMEKYNCQVICEIGVQEGRHFKLMIEHNPKIAVAIDPWFDNGTVSQNGSGYSQKALDEQYLYLKDLEKEKPFIQVVRECSVDAVSHYPEEYFDFVYIDGDHTYEAVLADINHWYPKVKKNGFLVGDDYINVTKTRNGLKFGVIKAVNEFAKVNNLKLYELPGFNWVIVK